MWRAMMPHPTTTCGTARGEPRDFCLTVGMFSRRSQSPTMSATNRLLYTFRPVPIEPSEEIPLRQADGTRVAHFGSKFLSMGVGTQTIEGRFDVRNVTKPTVAAGQVTDRGQGLCFVELRKQKGVHVIPCQEQSSNLFPLLEQESSQGRQKDRGEVEVEDERQARVKSAPVLPTDRETSMRSRMRRFAAGARRTWQDVRQKIPTNIQ